jgi:hypothetical protein
MSAEENRFVVLNSDVSYYIWYTYFIYDIII